MTLLALGGLIIAGALWWRAAGPSGGHLVDVRVPKLSETAAQGEVLFNENCAVCHGANAGGSQQGPPLVHIYYEPNHHGDDAFRFGIRHGVRQHHWNFGNMPPVPGVIEADAEKIIAYVRELQRFNGIN